MELNVHKLTVEEAIEEIMFKFEECEEIGDNTLKIIHGHKHGTRIKDTIRANVFLNETARYGFKIISKNYSDPGVSIFQFKSSKKSVKIKPKTSFHGIKTENRIPTKMCIKCKKPLILIKESNWYKCPKCGKLKK
ncbi:hypothetical protein LCGC14_2248810 [marine sediment metagenome]|uniref:Viral late gene transcription factor 3 zinc ribbon domain-containing protein n=1 Tax=marine sediment metagenome TaxID=412755 RepID=A0A0F9FY56_9ZZZZ